MSDGEELLAQQGATDPNAPPPGAEEYAQQELYGSPLQQFQAGLEGGVQGLLGETLGSALLRTAGAKPEEMRARAEANPVTHGLSQAGGFTAGLLAGTGEAAVLSKAGEAATAGLGISNKIGQAAIRGAFENALFASDVELAKKFNDDPNQTAGTAAIDLGLSTVIGGLAGGLIGKAQQYFKPDTSIISEMDRAGVESGDFRASIESDPNIPREEKESIFSALSKKKENAPEIEAAAKAIGAPVLEGMTSDNQLIQKAEDALLNGPPTVSSLRRQALYKQGFDAAESAVDSSLGDEATFSKAQLGNQLKEALATPIKQQAELLGQGYNELKQYHDIIPLSERSAPAIARNIEDLKELRLSPSSPEGSLAKRVINEIENLKTVDDVKEYKSILNRSISPTASSGEKRMVAILSDKLTNLEENSVRRFAETMKTGAAKEKILGLLDQREALNAQYKPFIEDVKELLGKLGKRKVYGPQDALNYIAEELTPEQVVDRLFSKNDSEFLDFFQKKFPNEMKLMGQYQKSVIRDQASKAGELSLKQVFNQVNRLEPEIAGKIFSPEELEKIQSAETYIRNMPKNFNPSGTSHMSAFRAFFEHPTGAVLGNIRDYGLEKFIKLTSGQPELNVAAKLAQATVNGQKMVDRSMKALFSPEASILPTRLLVSDKNIEKLKKHVEDLSANPSQMLDKGIQNNPIPEYNAAFGTMTAQAVQYLNSIRPKTGKAGALDTDRKPNQVEETSYNRAIAIAEQPLLALDHLKKGTLSQQDIQTLQAVHPALYRGLQMKLMESIINHTSKGKMIPYQIRPGLSLFLGQPVDSTFSPQNIIAAQPKPAMAPAQPQAAKGGKRSGSMQKLGKINAMYMTPQQANENRKMNGS